MTKKPAPKAKAVKPSPNPVEKAKAAKIRETKEKPAATTRFEAVKKVGEGTDKAELTPKQHKFALAVARGLTQADAYREAFSAKKMKAETIQEAASRLMADSKISARVDQIRTEITSKMAEEVSYEYKDAMAEAGDAIAMAKLMGHTGPMVAAIALKAKLSGLMVEERKNERSPVSGMAPDQMKSALEALQAMKKARAPA